MKPGDLYRVSLYLKGDFLDPSLVTALLETVPTQCFGKNERWLTSSSRVVTAKTGLWAISLQSETESLANLIQRLSEEVGDKVTLSEIPNVDEAYVDIFIAASGSEDRSDEVFFQVGPRELSMLHRLGVPVHFTVTVVPD